MSDIRTKYPIEDIREALAGTDFEIHDSAYTWSNQQTVMIKDDISRYSRMVEDDEGFVDGKWLTSGHRAIFCDCPTAGLPDLDNPGGYLSDLQVNHTTECAKGRACIPYLTPDDIRRP